MLTTHRSALARPLAALAWCGVGGSLGSLVFIGETRDGVEAAPWHFLAAWLIYCALRRPCVRTLDDGYELVNLLRDHRIPYGAVYGVRAPSTVAIRAEGRRYGSWSAPTRAGRDAVVRAWQDGSSAALPGPPTGVVSSWHRPTVVIGTGTALWALASTLV